MPDCSRFKSAIAILATQGLIGLACASPGGGGPSPPTLRSAGITDAATCVSALAASAGGSAAGLPGDAIRLLNWNVQKQTRTGHDADLARFSNGVDLILLQEAAQASEPRGERVGPLHRFFAPGYRSSSALTGVMTASSAPPITTCSFRNVEPWLRTPKATNVTEYALEGRSDTLLVVNLHVINFTVGVRDMRRQLDEAAALIAIHAGPVILSGDFNTWSERRARELTTAIAHLELESVDYGVDHRKRIFGRAVDHVYVRGIDVVESRSVVVTSSDHNPMIVTLRLQSPS